jgi:plasmid stabilization system protein ParE
VASVELARAAVDDIDRLVMMLSLPPDTSARVARSLRPLEQFPRLGVALHDRWDGLRCLVGPWRWMLMVYEYREEEDRVVVVTVQDARSSAAVTGD